MDLGCAEKTWTVPAGSEFLVMGHLSLLTAVRQIQHLVHPLYLTCPARLTEASVAREQTVEGTKVGHLWASILCHMEEKGD